MTAHVFQVFLDDRQTLAALTNIRRHLAPGGRLVFESRNPLVSEWRDWTEELTCERRTVAGVGPVEVYYQWRETDGDTVTFDAVFTLLETGEQRISKSTLRFASCETILSLLAEAGFARTDVCGWWDGTAFSPESREIIVSAWVDG